MNGLEVTDKNVIGASDWLDFGWTGHPNWVCHMTVGWRRVDLGGAEPIRTVIFCTVYELWAFKRCRRENFDVLSRSSLLIGWIGNWNSGFCYLMSCGSDDTPTSLLSIKRLDVGFDSEFRRLVGLIFWRESCSENLLGFDWTTLLGCLNIDVAKSRTVKQWPLFFWRFGEKKDEM